MCQVCSGLCVMVYLVWCYLGHSGNIYVKCAEAMWITKSGEVIYYKSSMGFVLCFVFDI